MNIIGLFDATRTHLVIAPNYLLESGKFMQQIRDDNCTTYCNLLLVLTDLSFESLQILADPIGCDSSLLCLDSFSHAIDAIDYMTRMEIDHIAQTCNECNLNNDWCSKRLPYQLARRTVATTTNADSMIRLHGAGKYLCEACFHYPNRGENISHYFEVVQFISQHSEAQCIARIDPDMWPLFTDDYERLWKEFDIKDADPTDAIASMQCTTMARMDNALRQLYESGKNGSVADEHFAMTGGNDWYEHWDQPETSYEGYPQCFTIVLYHAMLGCNDALVNELLPRVNKYSLYFIAKLVFFHNHPEFNLQLNAIKQYGLVSKRGTIIFAKDLNRFVDMKPTSFCKIKLLDQLYPHDDPILV